jgi:hypothetical protein
MNSKKIFGQIFLKSLHIACRFSADFQLFFADFGQISGDSETIHIQFSANSQPILNKF